MIFTRRTKKEAIPEEISKRELPTEDQEPQTEMRRSLEELKADWGTDSDSSTEDHEKPLLKKTQKVEPARSDEKTHQSDSAYSAQEEFMDKWFMKEELHQRDDKSPVRRKQETVSAYSAQEEFMDKWFKKDEKDYQSPARGKQARTHPSDLAQKEFMAKWLKKEDLHQREYKAPVRGKQTDSADRAQEEFRDNMTKKDDLHQRDEKSPPGGKQAKKRKSLSIVKRTDFFMSG